MWKQHNFETISNSNEGRFHQQPYQKEQYQNPKNSIQYLLSGKNKDGLSGNPQSQWRRD